MDSKYWIGTGFVKRRPQGAEKLGNTCRLLKKLQMQSRREEETGAYWVVRENAISAWRSNFRRPSTPQMDFFSSLLAAYRPFFIRTTILIGVPAKPNCLRRAFSR